MKNATFTLFLGAILITAATTLVADVDVNVNIGLPVVVLDSEPELAYIPGTYVYFIFGREDDFFFYQGYWWRPHRNRWYRSGLYNGPWVVIAPRRVPGPFLKLPNGWRSLPPGHARLKWGEVKHGWKQWEKEKRWDNKGGQKEGKARPGKSHGKKK
ncbi:MAG: hypothetical protein QME74_06975 [Candidatus Edwardsbacteria bacterium]|nr:hypothetical protein [Candidatus Edwardsbacteria bacterium]